MAKKHAKLPSMARVHQVLKTIDDFALQSISFHNLNKCNEQAVLCL